jgi:nucleotide-binding universal stress UspA family protein
MSPRPSTPAPLLIAYDGSDLARHAIEQAAALFPGVRAVVLSVYEPVPRIVPTPAGAAVPAIGDLRDESEHATEAARVRADELAEKGARLAEAAGLAATAVAAHGHGTAGIADAIVERARDAGAAIIVMGSHGRSAIGAALLGSVSHAVLHRASVPVLVVPASAEPS